MAGVAPGWGALGCILNSVGVPLHTPQVILDRFGEHFASVLRGGVDISPTTRDFLEYCVREVESSLEVRGEACDIAEPSLQEVADCVAALRNAVAPRANGIIAPLLKAGLEPVAWFHRVILDVWRSGRAPEAWKTAVVVLLYKGKGSHQCTNNYRGISLLNIPGKVYTFLLMHRLGQCVGGQLHEAQCGFRGGRGTIDAMFVLRQLSGRLRLVPTCSCT